MIHHRTLEEVRRFDRMKLIVTIVLIIILILLLLVWRAPTTPAAPAVEPGAETTGGAGAEEAVEVEPAAQVEAPALTSPGAGAELSPGELALSGTGQPGSEVQIVVDGQPVGTATVGDDGKWTFSTELGEPGDHEIEVQALDDSGEVAAASGAIPVAVAAPQVEEEAPVAPIAPTLDAPADGAEFSGGDLTLSGSGQPGTTLEILDGGAVIGTVEVDAAGGWEFTTRPDEGPHQYAVRPVGDEAAASSPVSVTVSRPATAGGQVCSGGFLTDAGKRYVVGSCETLGEVAARTDRTVEALLAANPEVEDPDRIFAGQVLDVPQE